MTFRVVVSFFTVAFLFFSLSSSVGAEAIIADHYAVADFDTIPSSSFDSVRTNYRFFYGHTSHGSQIVTGLNVLAGEDTLYEMPTFHEYGDDLGHNGDTSWVPPTRSWLNAHPEYNVAIWSWCGGCSDNTEEGIAIYLSAMDGLEQDYPGVTFIYMTGHLDGSGPEENLYARNNQIRAYCEANDKVLFDFADIESYDPDGAYYPYGSDYCEWCTDWCSSHPCPSCGCAHSQCFNCYLKGKAFWWMMARVWGWNEVKIVEPGELHKPSAYSLHQNYPNPFNPTTEIRYDLPARCHVTLEVYDLLGHRVATLVDGEEEAGRRSAHWNVGQQTEGDVAAGIYFCRLRAGAYSETMRMLLLR